MSFAYPPKANDILSLPVEDLLKATNIGVNAFAAAQAALPGFRDPIHKGHPKTFIVTGNVLPFLDVVPASYWALGVQKTIISPTHHKRMRQKDFNFISLQWYLRRGDFQILQRSSGQADQRMEKFTGN